MLEQAASEYGRALRKKTPDGLLHTLYSNRAAALLKLGKHDEALASASKVREKLRSGPLAKLHASDGPSTLTLRRPSRRSRMTSKHACAARAPTARCATTATPRPTTRTRCSSPRTRTSAGTPNPARC
jgi:hypothetical protein